MVEGGFQDNVPQQQFGREVLMRRASQRKEWFVRYT